MKARRVAGKRATARMWLAGAALSARTSVMMPMREGAHTGEVAYTFR